MAWRMSSGARNCPFFRFTTRPVAAAAVTRSVWRTRKAGIWRTSATSAARAACHGSWMSVRIGTPAASRTRPRIRSPSSIPGPRNDLVEVRLALSNEALNTYCTPARLALSRRARARATAWASLSITHGPAIRRSGDPPPTVSPANWIGVTPLTYHGRGRLLSGGDLVLIARADEAGEERVRLQRLRLELRMELYGHVPRVVPDLDDFDELAV